MNILRIPERLLRLLPAAALLSTIAAQATVDGGQKVQYDGALSNTASNTWVDLPGMSTSVELQGGGDLVVSLSMTASVAEEFQSPDLYVRLIVDNQQVGNEIRFMPAGDKSHNTVHFGTSQLTAGTHQVTAQWRTTVISPSFGGASSEHRTMTVRWAAPDTPHVRLGSAHYGSYSIVGSGNWTPMIGMNVTLDGTGANSFQWYRPRLLILVSGEFATNGASQRMWIRPLVNGVAPSDVVIRSGLEYQQRSFAFHVTPNHAGQFQVQLQGVGSSIGFYRNVTMAVVAVNETGNEESAYIGNHLPSAPMNVPATWTTVPDVGSGTIEVPRTSDLEVRFSAEYSLETDELMQLRCRFDGNVVNTPGVVVWRGQDNSGQGNTQEVSFVIPSVGAGPHTVEIEWAMLNGTGFFAERDLSVTAINGRATCPWQASLISSSTVENVSQDPIDVQFAIANQVDAVSIGGRIIGQDAPIAPGQGWFERVGTTLRVYPPQGIAIGTFQLRLHANHVWTSNAIPLQIVTSQDAVLSTPAQKPVGQDQEMVLSRGPVAPGSIGWILASFYDTPSAFPGFPAFAIGNQFQHLVILSGVLTFHPTAQATSYRLPTSPAFVGSSLHFQGLLFDGAAFHVSNAASTDYL